MSRKKGGKKHKKKETPSSNQAPVRIVEISVPEEPAPVSDTPEPAPDAPQERTAPGKGLLKVVLTASAAAGLIGLGVLFLRLQPLSRAYSLNVASSSFIFRVGEENDISYFFKQVTDIPILLRLQQNKREHVRFESSDESVVSVDSSGHLTAVGPGSADVTVSVADMSGSVHVDAFPRGRFLVFSDPERSLNSGEEMDLRAQVIPSDALLLEDIHYSVSDESVLEIDENGHLRAIAPGTSEVIAESEDLCVRTEISVLEPMTAIAFSRQTSGEALSMERGGHLSLPVRFFPKNTTDPKEVTYTVSDPEIATVAPNGLLSANNPGTVTVTAECNGFSDSVEVEVMVTLMGIRLNRAETTLIYQRQDQLTCEFVPSDTTDELSCIYTSDNPSAVSVDANGLVTAKGPGTATITAQVHEYTASCVYHVHVPVTGVSISAGSLTLNKGQTSRLTASVYPSFATEDRSISWRSDNPGVVSVDANGGIMAVNGGTARIYAVHGNFSNSCLVTVRVPVTRDVIASRIINFGKQFLGTRYVYGGNSLTGGIDCSSFVMQCFATQGIRLPRVSYQQVQCGYALPMDPSGWLPGDLLFYSPHGYVSHVAIYIGNGQILQSAESMGGVCITSYNYNGYTPSHARRVF